MIYPPNFIQWHSCMACTWGNSPVEISSSSNGVPRSNACKAWLAVLMGPSAVVKDAHVCTLIIYLPLQQMQNQASRKSICVSKLNFQPF
jgi:hypothetical protein